MPWKALRVVIAALGSVFSLTWLLVTQAATLDFVRQLLSRHSDIRHFLKPFMDAPWFWPAALTVVMLAATAASFWWPGTPPEKSGEVDASPPKNLTLAQVIHHVAWDSQWSSAQDRAASNYYAVIADEVKQALLDDPALRPRGKPFSLDRPMADDLRSRVPITPSDLDGKAICLLPIFVRAADGDLISNRCARGRLDQPDTRTGFYHVILNSRGVRNHWPLQSMFRRHVLRSWPIVRLLMLFDRLVALRSPASK